MSRPRKIRLRFDLVDLRRDTRDKRDASCNTVRREIPVRANDRRRKLTHALAVDKQRLENQGRAHISRWPAQAIAQVVVRQGLAHRRLTKHSRAQHRVCLADEAGAQHNSMERRCDGFVTRMRRLLSRATKLRLLR
jgi:hypothetical protein